ALQGLGERQADRQVTVDDRAVGVVLELHAVAQARVLEQGAEHRFALYRVDGEARALGALVHDKLADRAREPAIALLELVVGPDEEQHERRQPLLAVDDVAVAFPDMGDDRAEVIVAGDLRALSALERACEVPQHDLNVLMIPRVAALEGADGVIVSENAANV